MLRTDHTYSLKSRTRNFTGWYSGNVVGLYFGDAWFKSEPGHWLS
jgi:hypothetical protein